MELGLRGKTVVSQTFDYIVAMHLTDGYFLRLESSFTLVLSDRSVVITPDTDPEECLLPLRDLVGQTMTEWTVDDSGVLTIAFDSGAQLVCEPDSHYESWAVAYPDGTMVVCTPGGELGVWGPRIHRF